MNVLAKALALSVLISSGLGGTAAAQIYPNKPLRFVVPFAPGGGADLLARLVGSKVGESVGQQVVIDNRTGAGGNIAAEVVARSLPDGYTLLQANLGHAISTSLYRKLNYDLAKDFIPVSLLGSTPFILAVHPGVPAGSVRELIAFAKAKPGQLRYGSSGNGGPSHLGTEMFKSMTGVDMTHVPYKGGAPAAIDLIAGQIQVMFNTPPVILPHARSGRMKALAVASSRRIAAAPEMPTVAEAGPLPGFEIVTWYGLMVPAGTPGAIVKRVHAEFVAALNVPEVRSRLLNESIEPVGNSPVEFASYVKAEIAKWAKVVSTSGARVD